MLKFITSAFLQLEGPARANSPCYHVSSTSSSVTELAALFSITATSRANKSGLLVAEAVSLEVQKASNYDFFFKPGYTLQVDVAHISTHTNIHSRPSARVLSS